MGPLAPLLIASLAAPCAYPEEGAQALHRAVREVRVQPEIEAWSRDRRDKGEIVQYVLLLDEPLWSNGRCYWTLEVRIGEQVWHRFHVSPEGRLR